MLKIAVCDDEICFMDMLCPLLEQWAKEREVNLTIYRFTNGDDLIDAQRSGCMDLIILDVIMPLLNGIDTARELRNMNQTVPIVFLTSSREFAVDSYEVKAFHYLIKPVSQMNLFPMLDEFLKIFNSCKPFFTARTTDGFCRIFITDVDYLEAQNKQVLVHLSNDRTLVIRELFSKCAGPVFHSRIRTRGNNYAADQLHSHIILFKFGRRNSNQIIYRRLIHAAHGKRLRLSRRKKTIQGIL